MSTKHPRLSRATRLGGKQLGLAAVVLSLGCGPGGGVQSPAAPARSTQSMLAADAPLRQHVEAAGGYATSVDEHGVPTFIRATHAALPPAGLSHEAAARFHVQRFATGLGLGPSALSAMEPEVVGDHGAGGIVVHIKQRIGGVEIYRRELRLLMKADHSLVSIAGSLQPATEVVSPKAFVKSAPEALAAALSHAAGTVVAPSLVIDLHDAEGDLERYQLSPQSDVLLPQPAVVRKILLPGGEHLRASYFVEFYVEHGGEDDAPAWRYLVDAADGTVIERHSRTFHDAFNFRVWANANDKRPMDGPFVDFTPHPTGRSDWSYPAWVAPSYVSMEGFNKNPQGKSDPWLPAGATESKGNNADAYVDRNTPNGVAGDFRASVSSPGSFDYTYDVTQAPGSKTQTMAGIVQAFYDVNWLHDYWYDSGFNEKAGNGQSNNYSRGGRSGDPMLVETQDYSGRDNSNMSAMTDGSSPRMQLYLWSGRDSRVLHASGAIEADFSSASASFGLDNFDTTGVLSDTNDGSFPSVTDACDPIQNADQVKGKIALIDRGTCTFKKKAVNAEAAGAIGVIIVNNVPGDPPGMGNGDPMSTTVGIPVLSTTKDAGARLRDAMAMGDVTLHLVRRRDIDRDGGLDNTVIFHEWGHYLHHRLALCESGHQCNAMSEGWADFNALHTIARDGDDLDGTFALAIYASAQFTDPGYFGIRRLPYSVDTHKNGYTFKMIGDGVDLPKHMPLSGGGPNSEVHNAGEIWATMMWEAYVALHKSHRDRNDGKSFDDVRRLMANYVVAGLQITPDEATYTEQRDAILAAAGAVDPMDEQALAEAFARRGAGTCADSPPKSSSTLTETVEAFKVQPRLVVGTVTLDDSVASCDQDGVLDAGEKGKLTIELSNGSMKALQGAKLTVTALSAGASVTGQATFDIPNLDPFATTMVSTEVALDPAMADPATIGFRIQPSVDAACDNASYERDFKANYDVAPESTAKDDVEAAMTVWSPTGTGAPQLDGGPGVADAGSIDGSPELWSRVALDTSNHAWHGAISDGAADSALESPDLYVSPTEFFKIRFDHRYNFDSLAQGNTTLYLDGGVVEISLDGGQTWDDITTYADPGYDQKISPATGSKLGGGMAYADKSYSWPKMDWVEMNLLDKLAGKTVRIRFRVSSGGYFLGATGWDIDNITFSGITNTPFAGSTFDAGKCGSGPRGAKLAGGGCAMHAGRSSTGAGLLVIAMLPLAALLVRRRRPRTAK